MKVFLTGAAGFIGRAVTTDLLAHGHQVLGLCRNEASAKTIKDAGGEPHWGDIEDPASLTRAVSQVDGVIHLAFTMSFADFPRACAIDRSAIQIMAEALKGTNKPLIMTSGTLLLPGDGTLVDENTPPNREGSLAVRAQSEDLLRRLSQELGIWGCVVRLAPVVHGQEDKGFVAMLGGRARKNEYVAYVKEDEDGKKTFRWPAVHRLDAAALFRLVLEKGLAGSVYHGVAEEGVALKEVMEAIGRKLNLPVEGKSQEEAKEVLGFFANLVNLDNFVSSVRTRDELGWRPSREGLLEDIDGTYFGDVQ